MNFDELNEWSNDQLYQFFHKIFDILCDMTFNDFGQSKNYHLSFDNNGEKFFNKFPTINNNRLNILIDYWMQFFIENADGKNLTQQLKMINLNENIIKCIQDQFELRRLSLMKSIIFNMIKSNYNYIENYDWNIKHIVCNEKSINLQQILFTLSLIVFDINQQQRKTIILEMNRNELNTFIQILQKAEKDLHEKLL